MARWVLHADLDQFIAAVEVLRRPELRGRPVVVGGDGDPAKRGVVSTASYEARACGVHSGLPLRTAARRCPDAVFLPVDRDAYEAVSDRVMAALRSLGVVVEVLGWDEAFLAVDGDDPEAVARELRARVRAATGLECTVGIGRNKLQAKLATGFGKPAGIFRLTGETWFDVLGDRPTDALWGVGAKTAKRLKGLGIATVGQLAAADPRALAAEMGPTIGPWLVLLAQGRDNSPVSDAPYVPRSAGPGDHLPAGSGRLGRRAPGGRPPGAVGRGRCGRRREGRRPRHREGPVRAVHHSHPRQDAVGAHERPGRDRGGRPRGARPVHRTPAGAAAGRPRRVRTLT
ncbi:DNA polymerase IV [Actinomadura madurae]|nr:DNA polymerase IV [Actinomadura madurae]MCP9952999.1 DNA polymerase IV [Actinomadura madurae]MCP9969762.1 DNA polymerase IV [Actinomadura madurae]MCP9982215.1 DNA polymerase IV [Actinomadura madurae]MCQ0018461.1 DNA polymerase IV [Actinomadura madurae]